VGSPRPCVLRLVQVAHVAELLKIHIEDELFVDQGGTRRFRCNEADTAFGRRLRKVIQARRDLSAKGMLVALLAICEIGETGMVIDEKSNVLRTS